MESLQWFALGIITMLAINAMVYAHMVIKLPKHALPLLLTGVLFILFGLAWGGSSLLEGYPQSSAMGIVIFCGIGFVISVLTWRKLVAPGLK
jgi:hypothetical protein